MYILDPKGRSCIGEFGIAQHVQLSELLKESKATCLALPIRVRGVTVLW